MCEGKSVPLCVKEVCSVMCEGKSVLLCVKERVFRYV